MLIHPVLITSESPAKNTIWSKDGHGAHLSTTIFLLEAKPVHEA